MNRQDFNQMMKASFGDRVTNIPSKTDNQLIAEFMNVETVSGVSKPIHTGNKGEEVLYYLPFPVGNLRGNRYEAHDLSYDVSWDWLMPVIEKIATHTLSYTIEMLSEYYYKDGDNQDGLEGIEEFHKAVVFYIKNNNLKNI